MKKMLAIGLVLALCLGCVSAMAESDVRTVFEDVQLEGGSVGFRAYMYTVLEDGSAELHEYYREATIELEDGTHERRSDFGTDETLTIPDTLDGFPVTSIGSQAFSFCQLLSIVIIPVSVTVIGDHAFESCTSLTSVMIPDSVTAIGNSAFYRCRNLTDLVIPDSVTSIGDDAFNRCSNLTLTVGRGSYAEQYCIDNGLNYQYAE